MYREIVFPSEHQPVYKFPKETYGKKVEIIVEEAFVDDSKATATPPDDSYIINNVPIKKASHKQRITEMAGSLTNLNLHADKIRGEAWSRNK
jgi:hypothetical protein